MKINASTTNILACLLTASALLLASGCGGDGFGKRYAVSGKVTYKGQPVPKGNIYFVPDDPESRSAESPIASDGSYTLSTANPGDEDGAFPGTYKIRVVAIEADYSQVKANAGGGAGRQDDVFKATQSAKQLVPPKYRETSTSGLTAKVEEHSNTINFDLAD